MSKIQMPEGPSRISSASWVRHGRAAQLMNARGRLYWFFAPDRSTHTSERKGHAAARLFVRRTPAFRLWRSRVADTTAECHDLMVSRRLSITSRAANRIALPSALRRRRTRDDRCRRTAHRSQPRASCASETADPGPRQSRLSRSPADRKENPRRSERIWEPVARSPCRGQAWSGSAAFHPTPGR